MNKNNQLHDAHVKVYTQNKNKNKNKNKNENEKCIKNMSEERKALIRAINQALHDYTDEELNTMLITFYKTWEEVYNEPITEIH